MAAPAYRVSVPDLSFYQASIPCQFAYPVRTDARGYVMAIAQGEYERAYLIARETHPFAATCGWVCGAALQSPMRVFAMSPAGAVEITRYT
jgi:formate dehydrogenase (NADP+) beta subunit